MPSVTYMNQSAPFWDFVASLENVAPRTGEEEQGEHPPPPPPLGPWGWGPGFGGRRHGRRHWHDNRDTENEKEKDNEKSGEDANEEHPEGFSHPPPPFGPWGWGHDFGGRGFAHRGHGRRHWRENRDTENEKEKENEGVKDVDMEKENNNNGEGPSGTGSDTEGRRRRHGRHMHGRCGKGRKDRENTNENGEGSGSETEGCCRRGGRGKWGHGRHAWGPYGHGPHGGPGRHGPPGPPPHGFGPFGPGPFGPGPHGPPPHDFGFGPRGAHHHGGPHHERERGWGGRRGGPWGGRGGFNPWAFAAQFLNPENYNNASDAKDGETGDFSPEADIFDTETTYVIHVSLPGAKKEDVGVNWDAEKSELSVAGVVYRPGDEDFLKTLAMDERKTGPFERKIRLGTRVNPAQIDADGISAKLEDGILRIDVPKRLEEGFVEVRKVDIE